MSTENGRDSILQAILSSLINEEISMANEVYKLGETLEASLIPEHINATGNPAWIESLSSLDSCIEDTLSEVIQKEIVAIGKIESGLLQYRNSESGR